MSTEDGTFHNCSQRQIIEKICQHFPYICIFVFSGAFVEKSVVLGNRARLVVSSQDRKSFFISDFQTQQQAYCFD